MGIVLTIQYELITKQIKPCFQVPKDKLVDLEKLKAKAKPLHSVLKVPNKTIVVRKDLAANWDEAF
jgi:hypothetical protein